MKLVKKLTLGAVGVALFLAFAAPASATQVTAPSGTLYTGSLAMGSEGSITIHGVTDVTCNGSAIGGSISSHGAGVTAKGSITGLVFADCNQHVSILSLGSFELHSTGGWGNATYTWSGAKITVEFTTIFGNVHCVFGTSNTDIGLLTTAVYDTGHGHLDVDSAPISTTEGSFLCGSSAELTGSYKVATPTGIRID
jgi:hypothetical protein